MAALDADWPSLAEKRNSGNRDSASLETGLLLTIVHFLGSWLQANLFQTKTDFSSKKLEEPLFCLKYVDMQPDVSVSSGPLLGG